MDQISICQKVENMFYVFIMESDWFLILHEVSTFKFSPHRSCIYKQIVKLPMKLSPIPLPSLGLLTRTHSLTHSLTHWSVCIMLLCPIWSLSPGSGLGWYAPNIIKSGCFYCKPWTLRGIIANHVENLNKVFNYLF